MLCQFFVMILISATSILTCCYMLSIKQLNTMNMKNKTCHTVEEFKHPITQSKKEAEWISLANTYTTAQFSGLA